MLILGLSGFFHDSAAALIADGQLVAAAHEERFSRIRHDPAFPAQAATWCLQQAGIDQSQLDFIVWFEKPLRHFERLLETATAFAPRGLRSFTAAMPPWLEEKLWMPSVIRRHFPRATNAALAFLEHHQSHAASAFFPSPFQKAAVLTVDGVGEWATASWGTAEGNRIQLIRELHFPHSLGLLYSAFTGHLGFRVNSGEYKVMGLAPYGQPVHADIIRQQLLDRRSDGSFRLRQEFFQYCHGLRMTNRQFTRLFGIPPRTPESLLLQCHMDVAASIQVVAEDLLLDMARHVHQQTQLENLVMAGGVALNCVANSRLQREGPFNRVWVQPAAGDAGAALGAALFVWHHLLGKPRKPPTPDGCRASLTGPSFDSPRIQSVLRTYGVNHQHFSDEKILTQHVAQLLAQGKTVGWFQGAMEFGPRALGHRSILADARSHSIQTALNLQVKFRESFRPFAPVVLREHAHKWFTTEPDADLPYMLFTAQVHPDKLTQLSATDRHTLLHSPDLLQRVRIPRSLIPAVTHVDSSARIQTVDHIRHPKLHRLLTAFENLTGCPVLVNTSFNVRGEPIVCTPEDALACFQATRLDVLVMEDCLIVDKHFTPPQRTRLTAQSGQQPDLRMLRQFALLWMLLNISAVVTTHIQQRPTWVPLCLSAVAALSIPAIVYPALARPLFLFLIWATTPLRWLTSRLLLLTIFTGLVCPIALLLRCLRHDPLQRHPSDKHSFWQSTDRHTSSPLRPW